MLSSSSYELLTACFVETLWIPDEMLNCSTMLLIPPTALHALLIECLSCLHPYAVQFLYLADYIYLVPGHPQYSFLSLHFNL